MLSSLLLRRAASLSARAAARGAHLHPGAAALCEAMAALGHAPFDPSMDRAEMLRRLNAATEEVHLLMGGAAPAASPLEVGEEEEDVGGVACNVYTPRGQPGGGAPPCIVYLHGGGMAVYSKDTPYVRQFCRLLGTGAVVIAPEFVSSLVRPFPGGLEDVYAALSWAVEGKRAGKYSAVIAAGDSGGGNLAVAATLLHLHRGGGEGDVDGVYCVAPYVLDMPPDAGMDELKGSMKEYGGGQHWLMLDRLKNTAAAYAYGPSSGLPRHMAWPAHAAGDDWKGFPRTRINVSSHDMLRDQGVELHRSMTSAGVEASLVESHGMAHICQILYGIAPAEARLTAKDVLAFAALPPPARG